MAATHLVRIFLKYLKEIIFKRSKMSQREFGHPPVLPAISESGRIIP